MTTPMRIKSAFLFLILVWLIPASASPVVGTAGPASVNVGDTFTVSVAISGAVDVYAFQFDFSFDPTILRATLVTEGTLLAALGATVFLSGAIDNSVGSIASLADALVGVGPGAFGDGSLVDITFEALAVGVSGLSISNAFLLNSSLADITSDATFIPGTLTVAAIGSVPEPTSLALVALGILGIRLARRKRGRFGQ